MTERETQRTVGVIPVLLGFGGLGVIGALLFLVIGIRPQDETVDLPSGANVAAAIDGAARASEGSGTGTGAGDTGPPGSDTDGVAQDGVAPDGGDTADGVNQPSSSSSGVTGSSGGTATSDGATTGTSGDSSSNSGAGSQGSSGSSGSSGTGGTSSGQTSQGNPGSGPGSGQSGTTPSPTNPPAGSTPSPDVQRDAAAAGIKILSGSLQIVTFNVHQSGISVVFYIPPEMRGFGTRSAIPPITATPTSDGRALTVRVACHSSATELLGQLSVSETNRQVLVGGASVIPSDGAPCAASATPLTVELPLRQPLGDRLLTVMPAT